MQIGNCEWIGQGDINYKYTEESSTQMTLGSCPTVEKPIMSYGYDLCKRDELEL